MALQKLTTADELERGSTLALAHTCAVSWSAILAGATAIAALSLILLLLGTGLGLSSVSPWVHEGITAKTLGLSAILWLTLTQILASGMGGYLAGRLRTKWVGVHMDEAYFRDTAHGFLAWAVAALATAALLTSTIGTIVSGGIHTGAFVARGGAMAAKMAGPELENFHTNGGPMGYFVDSLFRKDSNAPTATPTDKTNDHPSNYIAVAEQPTAESASEVTRIFMNTVHTGPLPVEDVSYVGQMVAQRTGLTQQDAEKRVSDTYARVQAKLHDTETAAKDAADKVRKASAYTALWLFISLLIGAFVASVAAICGGRWRDGIHSYN